MRKPLRFLCFTLLSVLIINKSFSQTSWKGVTSTNWAIATNWTAGVPTATTDAIIGDASFTGAFQPAISSAATAKSLTIGGSVASQLTVSSTLTVKGNITINANGGIINGNASISLSGNWSNAGSYSTTSTNSTVIFNGTTQALGGTSVTTFRKLTINTGSVLTLTSNVISTGASGLVTVNGTLNPNEPTTYLLTTDNLTVANAGVLKVNAAAFASNYIINTLFTLSAGSIVEYSATTINQTVSSAYTYSTLRVSGAGTIKSLATDLPPLRSTSSSTGNIYVLSGTFDLSNRLANRGTTIAGGTLSVSNGASLKIGGTNGFPSGYNSNTLSLTSTVEYNGGDQAVSSKTYGNLVLSSAAGTATKTMPVTAFTVAGSFTSNVGAGSAVNYTAASNITVTGSMNIGPSTTFDGSTFSHTITGNWNNTGTFTPSTSTITLKGASTSITGNATQPFNNLTITGSNITAPSVTTINIAGNFVTSGSGTFTQVSPGTFNMTGTTKTLTGTGINLNTLNVSGTITTTATCVLTGDVVVTGSFTAPSSGILTMNGSGKTISNSGTLTFRALVISGSVSTASNFTVGSSLNCTGSITATANTVTFTGSSLLSGTANLYNVVINGTSLALASNAVMGVAGAFSITAGTFNVTSYIPNTVNYNGSAGQSVKGGAYNNIIFSNGGTKTALAAITVNNALTIGVSTTFDAVNFTHVLAGNWTNNGTFVPNTGTVQLTGNTNVTITGTTTFYNLTVNKGASTYSVTLASSISVYGVAMTQGSMNTGANSITMTSATTGRTGNGIILGTITRTHAFSAATAYAFEGPYNTITFGTLSGVTSVTVNVTVQTVADFPYGGAIGRYYNITVPAGTYSNTILRLHYEDAELNGNDEATMQLWKYSGSAWAASGKSANSTTNNYVERNNLSNITDRWTMTDDGSVLNWTGAVNADWSNAGNWSLVQGTFSGAPTPTDIAQIGVAAFTNQPTITTAATAKAITFGSTQAVTLSLSTGGSLTAGSINGEWNANATHTINAGTQNITVNGDMVLSDNTAGHNINLNINTGLITVTGNVVESGNANINFTGAGNLYIGKDFNYSSGTFTAGTGTVRYNGTASQLVAPVNYYNLTIAKTAGTIATLSNNCSVGGTLTVSTGELDVAGTVNISGAVSIAGTSVLDGNAATLNVSGNWTKAATAAFNAGNGSVIMVGAGTQTVSAGAFNIFTVNKTSGSVVLSGNNTLNGNLNLLAGTLNLSTYTFNQSSAGDIFTISDNATLLVSGAANFPSNFVTYTLGTNSLVHYNGTVAQTVADVTYGNLTFSNGAALEKTFAGSSTVTGDITINSGASLNGGNNVISLNGNWINNGTFNAGAGDIILNGTSKTLTGNTTFNDVTINGSYSVATSNMTFNGQFQVTSTGSYTAGTGVATVNGDFTNSGSCTSAGTTTFTGTALQTIRLINALVSTSTGVVNFNGSVSPVFNSTSTPTFATLNINNTAGINPSVNWVVLGPFTVSNGASFNGGVSTHSFSSNFTNNGTVTSSGVLNFNSSSAASIQLSGTNFSSTGTVVFGGSGVVTISGTPASLQNVTIANTNAAGITAPSAWTMNGSFTINSDAIFNAGSFTHTVAGDIESDGILNGNSSTFNMTSVNGSLSGSPGTVFNNLIISGTVTANSDYNVSTDFFNNGTYDGSIGALTMVGSGPSAIGGTTTPSPIALLTVSKTGGAVVTDNVNINSITALIINSGTLFTSTYSIAQNAAGGVIIIMSGATLKLGGTNTIPAFSGYGFDVNSTVEYAGTTQTIANGPVYGNLTISAAGNKNAPSFLPLTIAGNMTITAGNFIANNNTHSIAGNWLMTGGTFTNTNSIIRFNGSTDQSIQTIAAFNNVNISKSGGLVTLSSDITVNAALSFTLGKVQTGNYAVIIPSTGSVTGAGQSTGWVIGNLQKNVATGSSVSRTFEVGGVNYYTPATVLFASVGTAGNLTGSVTLNDHTQIDYSGIDSLKSVNRYWSFTNSGTVFTTATSTFNWVATDVDAGATTANFKTASYNAGAWTLNNVASPLSTSIQSTGLTSFGDFAIGERVSLYKWTGEAFTADWGTAKNWQGGVPTTSLNTLIPSGITGGRVYPTLSTGTGAVNNITIESGAGVTVTTGTLQVAGAITNSGIMDVTNGTVEFNGSAAQTISAGLFRFNKVKNLIISNNVSLAGEDTLTGTLTIATGKTFTTNDYLSLKSDAAGTARIATLPVDGSGNATAFISGKVYIERYIPMRKAWRLLSAPVKTSGAPTINEAWQEGAGSVSFNSNPNPGYGVFIIGGTAANGYDQGITSTSSIRVFNNASGSFVSLPSAPGTNTAITNYPGYFLYVRGDRSIDLSQGNSAATTSTTLRMKGQLNTGSIQTGVNATGYTILGNPYASAIDFETLTKSNVKNSFYVWDPKLSGTYGLGGYVAFSWNSGTGTYDNTTSASPLSKFIQSGEAIIIESADGTNPGTITVKESDKTANGSDGVYGRMNLQSQLVRVNLFSVNADASTALLDGVLTTYHDHNLNIVDGNDAKKLNGGSENIGIKRDGKMLSIERRKTITVTDTTFLNLYQMKLGKYQMQITADNMNRNGVTAVLKDNYSNTINNRQVDMNGITTVDFTITSDPASYAINRFSIVFIPKQKANTAFETNKAYRRKNDIAVEWKVDNETAVKQYEVERSADGVNFSKINTTIPVAKNDEAAGYMILDTNPTDENNYYRIRFIEEQGRSVYSNVMTVGKLVKTVEKGTPSVIVYPNPVTGNIISMQMKNMEKGNYTLQLFNEAGQLVATKSIQYNGTDATIGFDVNQHFAGGKYELRVSGNNTKITMAVIKR